MPFKNVVVYRISKNNPGCGKRLAKALGCSIVTSVTSSLPEKCLVLNYGRSELPKFHFNMGNFNYLNHPWSVDRAVNKKITLNILKEREIPCLEFSSSKHEAKEWIKQGNKVICRKTLAGKQGNGILLLQPGSSETVPECPLYTKYYDKTHEFRVHVFNNEVIDFVQKKKMGKAKLKKRGLTKADLVLRNHKRGWVFAHNNLVCHGLNQVIIDVIACEAVKALGLNFGGVDILAKFKEDGEFVDAVVCEINSAPGMRCEKTFNGYIKAVNTFLGRV